MQQEPETGLSTEGVPQESFLANFTRVPSGLDPSQVYSHVLKLSARIEHLEAQARKTSAPVILESALREAVELRTQASQAAERAYDEIVEGASREADRIKEEAGRRAEEIVAEARASLEDTRRQADELLAEARAEADRLRRVADEQIARDEQDFEQICADFAGFLQRILDRKSPAERLGSTAPASLAAWPAAAAAPASGPAQDRGPAEAPAETDLAAVGEPWSAETESAQEIGQAGAETRAPELAPPAEAEQPAGDQPADRPPDRGFRLPNWLDS